MQLSAAFSRLVTKLRTSNKGFTMIELLIVIAILGILAVAVLSAINPIEQINRGRDTGSRSDAEQLISAIDRFHALRGYYPWVSSAADDDVDQPWLTTKVLGDWLDNQGGTCEVLNKLGSGNDTAGVPCTGADELKKSYLDRITNTQYNDLYVWNRGDTGDSTYVCFEPNSGAFKQEAQERCANFASTGLPVDFPGTEACDDVAEEYYICLP